MSRRRTCSVRRLLCLFIVSAAVVGCTDGEPSVEVAVDGSIYETVIADLVDRAGHEFQDDGEQLPVIYVETLGSEIISLETQVDVVSRFEERYEIRFIDSLEEAIDVDLDDRPVQPNSLLVGLGPVIADGSSALGAAEVRGELYLDAGDQRAYRYVLDPQPSDVWVIVGSPETVEPEGFVVS